jgi:hypothetical protein
LQGKKHHIAQPGYTELNITVKVREKWERK